MVPSAHCMKPIAKSAYTDVPCRLDALFAVEKCLPVHWATFTGDIASTI